MRTAEILEIDPDTANEIQQSASQIADREGGILGSDLAIISALDNAREIATLFPPEIVQRTEEFRKRGNDVGALVLRGLTPPSDMQNSRPDKDGNLPNTPAANATGLIALAAASLVGDPFTYSTNPRGRLPTFISPITPMEQDATPNAQGLVRSADQIGWHTEAGTAQIHNRIEFLSLYCVNPQANAPTNVIPGDAIARRLELKDRLAMREHQFMVSDAIVPDSYANPRPLIADTSRGAAITYSSWYAEDDKTSQDRYTLAQLTKLGAAVAQAAETDTVRHDHQAGDVLLIDNNGPHARDRFEPDWPNPRYLLRTFVGRRGQGILVNPVD
jgi:hypothetical protein